jgi:hypothetical protein
MRFENCIALKMHNAVARRSRAKTAKEKRLKTVIYQERAKVKHFLRGCAGDELIMLLSLRDCDYQTRNQDARAFYTLRTLAQITAEWRGSILGTKQTEDGLVERNAQDTLEDITASYHDNRTNGALKEFLEQHMDGIRSTKECNKTIIRFVNLLPISQR